MWTETHINDNAIVSSGASLPMVCDRHSDQRNQGSEELREVSRATDTRDGHECLVWTRF